MARQLAREIIFAIGDNMREGLEPLLTKTLAPSLYQVYLHAEDFDRLRTIFPQIEEEARTYLDRQLEELNQGSVPVAHRMRDRLPERLRGTATPAEPAVRHVPAEGTWHIRFDEDPNDALQPGEIEVVSELAVGETPDYGGGSRTQKIAVSTTRRLGRSATRRLEVATLDAHGHRAAVQAGHESAVVDRSAETISGAAGILPPPLVGVLRYQDEDGDHRFEIDKEEVFVGRGAVDVWVDVRLRTKADVSRRHLRIERRVGEERGSTSASFWIEDLSQFGTTVDGVALQRETPRELPSAATIELASVLRLQFCLEPSQESA